MGAVYLGSLLLLALLLPGFTIRLPPTKELEESSESSWRVVVDREYRIIDQRLTTKRQEARAAMVRPVFRIQDELTADILTSYETALSLINEYLGRWGDRELFLLKLSEAFPNLDAGEILAILERQPDLSVYLAAQRELLTSALEKGVIDDLAHPLPPLGVEVRARRNGTEVKQIYPRDQVVTLSQLRQARLGLIAFFARPNTVFDQRSTEEAVQSAISTTIPVVVTFRPGEVLLEKGERITAEKKERLQALALALHQEFLSRLPALIVVLGLLILLAFLLFRGAFSSHSDRHRLAVFFLGSWFVFLTHQVLFGLSEGEGLRQLSSPLGLIVLLAALLTGRVAATVFALLASMPVVLFVPSATWVDLGLPAALAAFVFDRVQGRFHVLLGGLFYGLLLGAYQGVGQLYTQGWGSPWALYALGGLLNGVLSGVVSLGLLPALETVLNLSSRFRYQELSDLNSPILRKMLALAPGTYAHSIKVSHLAENAARAIGADALLARVGAIYHDIGKIEQAEYFVENQTGNNPHDQLAPLKSVAILRNHVSRGYELGRELHLPRPVLDIILQHHGQGLIEYFYKKACAQSRKVLPEDEFRYAGPNPQFKESGIVMLADTVEAASRTLTNPDYLTLRDFVASLVQKRIQEGLLYESGLTLGEIRTIQEVLIHSLVGQFHTRLEYPEAVPGR